MNEVDHGLLVYEGAPGEQVTINVTPHGTGHIVTYNLNNVSHVLPAGAAIRFNLGGESGDVTRLQLIMDFNHEGDYEYVVANVVDCTGVVITPNTCTHRRDGPPLVIENFTFSVV